MYIGYLTSMGYIQSYTTLDGVSVRDWSLITGREGGYKKGKS